MNDSTPQIPVPDSVPAAAPARLERGYRRLIAVYPRSFRKENEEEILTVLLATAREGQRRPSLGESADLLRGAARMRTGLYRSPRTVLNAVRLMYLGAAAQLAVLITIILTAGEIRGAVLRAVATNHDPALTAKMLQAVNFELVADLVVLPLGIMLWIFIAWANGLGYDWARLVAVACFSLNSISMLIHLAQGSATYAPAATIASGVVWAIGLASIVLIFLKQSWPYYGQQPATAR